MSTDNGNTFTKKASGTARRLLDIACNGNTWGIVGAGGTVLMSADDGKTFTQKASGTIETLTDIACNGNTWGIIGNEGTILMSTDAALW